jgi:hypothetical protein
MYWRRAGASYGYGSDCWTSGWRIVDRLEFGAGRPPSDEQRRLLLSDVSLAVVRAENETWQRHHRDRSLARSPRRCRPTTFLRGRRRAWRTGLRRDYWKSAFAEWRAPFVGLGGREDKLKAEEGLTVCVERAVCLGHIDGRLQPLSFPYFDESLPITRVCFTKDGG